MVETAEQDTVAAETRKQIAGRALAMQLAQDVAAGLGGGLETLAAEGAAADPEDQQLRYDGEGPCPWCGSTNWTTKEQEYEEVILPITNSSGLTIPGQHPEIDENGRSVMRPTRIPFYRPDVFPVVLQKSVSVYGQLLGNSDVDVIEDQQNTTNRMEKKIIDRLVKAGTRITLPAKATRGRTRWTENAGSWIPRPTSHDRRVPVFRRPAVRADVPGDGL